MPGNSGNISKFLWTKQQLATSKLLVPRAENPEILFAARELARYIGAMTASHVPISREEALPSCTLVMSAEPRAPLADLPTHPVTSVEVAVSRKWVAIRAARPRDLLYGAYEFLESLGARWSLWGPAQEHVPKLADAPLLLTAIPDRRGFQAIGYCSDIITWHYTQPDLLHARVLEDTVFIDWMAKTGASRFFFIRHPFDTSSVIPELAQQFTERGIAIEVGGHIIPQLLPRSLYATHPEYFPMDHQGKRLPTANVCPSDRAALAVIAEEALRFLEESGQPEALHLWGADVFGGGWCRCRSCGELSPQDQSLLVCNAVARVFDSHGLPTPVYYLAYHDTIEPNLHIEPHPQVFCEFAPRERCYGHSLADRSCGTNSYYRQALATYCEQFPKRVRVFEYFGDAILFFGCLVPIPNVIAEDVAFYQELGICELFFLQFGAFSRWAYAPNFASFAAATCGKSGDPALQALWAQWSAQPQLLADIFAELEQVLRTAVQYGDVRLVPRHRVRAHALRQTLPAQLPKLTRLAATLEAQGEDTLRALALLVRYTQMVLEGVAYELETGSSGRAIFRRALELTTAIDRRYKGVWGEIDLPIIHDLYEAAPLVPGWG